MGNKENNRRNRLIDDTAYNSLSALLLSRYFNQALNGGSKDPSGDSSKLMVRLVSSIAEASVQPGISVAIKKIDELVEGLSSNIHQQLGSALPAQNFEELAKALSNTKEDSKPFDEVVDLMGMGERMKLIDVKSLKRKVQLTESLKSLKWLLTEGPSGTGRARMGFAINTEMEWGSSYPWNNFSAPVLFHLNNSGPAMAKGLVLGHIRQMLDNIKILRRAELEIIGKYEPEINDHQIASIGWDDLTEKEKGIVPPVILIGNRGKLAAKDFDALIGLLGSNLPVKVIILDDAVPAIDQAATDIINGTGILFPAIALQHVQVLKTSLAAPAHMFQGLSDIFRSNIPALAWIFAPAITKHTATADAWPKLNALALNARAFTLFNFKPGREGILLSSRLDIESNPMFGSDWNQSNLAYSENGEAKTIPYALTWADWAFTIISWRPSFTDYHEAMGSPVALSDFILLSVSERTGKTAVIYRIGQDGELKKYRVSEDVIKATEACAKGWLVLREISGELTAYPEKLKQKTELELSDKYEKKMEALKNEYEAKLAGHDTEYLEKIRVKLKEKLLFLSKQATTKS